VALRKINIYALRIQADVLSLSLSLSASESGATRTGPSLYMALACPRVRALSAVRSPEDGTRGWWEGEGEGGREKMRERSGRPRARDARSLPIRLIYGSNN